MILFQEHSNWFCAANNEGRSSLNPDGTDFTLCLEYSLFCAVGSIALLIVGLRIRHLFTKQPHNHGRTASIYWPSQVLILAASIILLVRCAYGFFTAGASLAYMLGTFSMGVAWLFALALNHYEHKYTIRSSDTLVLLYMATTLALVINLRTLFTLDRTVQPHIFLNFATLVFLSLGFVFEIWPRGSTRVQQLSEAQEYEKSNLFSRLSIHYFQPTISLAARQQILRPADIAKQLPEKHNTEHGYARLSASWNKKVQQYNERATNAAAQGFNDSKAIKKPSLLATIIRTYWKELVPIILTRIIIPFLEFLQPALLGLLLDYMQGSFADGSSVTTSLSSKTGGGEEKPLSYGLVLAFGMFFSSAFTSVLYAFALRRVFLLGTEINSALVAMIYRKALRLSPDARRQSSTGAVTNHMSVDAALWRESIDPLTIFISLPVDFSICLYMLYRLLGWSFLAGLLTALALVPIQLWRARVCEKLEDDRLKATDERVRLTSEILSNIKVVKLYGWEHAFRKAVLVTRDMELKILKNIGSVEAFMSLVFASSSVIVGTVTFAVYVAFGRGELTPKVVFVSISLFDRLHEPLTRLAEGVSDTVSVVVATKRIQRFLFREEIDNSQVIREKFDEGNTTQSAIDIQDATLSWASGKPLEAEQDADEDEEHIEGTDESQALMSEHEHSEDINCDQPTKPALQNINLTIQPKTLTAIVGRVGQGKSSLLSGIIGEMYKTQGSIHVRGRVAYVPQQAWILNATLRENILFGSVFDQERYRHVLDVCGLEPDLAMLPAGDQTEIGERGINLSGGQKQRISLARATYQDADIYLLDDPLSAVDAHVDQHLWSNLIGPQGLLKSKTRVLVTHGVHHLDEVDQILVMKEGEIAEIGRYEELMTAKQSFFELIREYAAKRTQKRRNSHAISSSLPSSSEATVDDTVVEESGGSETDSDNVTIDQEGDNGLKKQLMQGADDDEEREDELIAEETMKKGAVDWGYVKMYLRACSIKITVVVVLVNIITELCMVGTSLWLKHWISKSKEELASSLPLFLGVHAALSIVYVMLYIVFVYLILAVGRIRASELIHQRLISTIVRLPMSFFDTTPIGRIVNRFSSDLYSIDEHLPWKCMDLVYVCIAVTTTLIMVSYTTPIFVAFIPVLGAGYYLIQEHYLWASRSLKRMNSTSLSPLYQHFDETLNGVATIRAMALQQQFIEENRKRTDYSSNAFTAYAYCNRWVDLRLQWLGDGIILFVALSGVFGRYTLDPSLVGLALNYALNVTDMIMWLCRDFQEWQSHLIAVERVQEYTDKHPEAPEALDRTVPIHWPDQGQIVFKDFSARYREGLDLVIKHLSFEVQPGEKVGIVGRTGAGKSSLTLALFRIIEAANSHWARASDNSGYYEKIQAANEERVPLLHAQSFSANNLDEEIDGGRIEIDGVDISTLGLTDLRRHLAIIPQDPTLFAGTVRGNLDPFQEVPDSDLWEALERAHLKDFIRTLPGGLSAAVSQNGENFSVGQRSLLSLARALLRKSKILILDEATAAVDMETDELIQRTIRQEFQDRTVLTIAHRIKTVMDANKILVMERGEVVEFDAPNVLLQQPESLFFKLAHQAGEVDNID